MKYPNADQMNIFKLVRSLDSEKAGLIPFMRLMEFIENNTTIPAFPDADSICSKIANAIVKDKQKNVYEYLASLNIKEKDAISVIDFAERIGKPSGITAKDAYYVYYKIKPITEKRLSGETLKTVFENQLEEGNQDEQVSHIKEETVIEDAPEDMNKELAVGIVKLYDLIFAESSKKRMSEQLVYDKFDTDKSRSLNKFEFKEGLKKLGLKLTEKEIEEMIIFADTNKDGKISLQEFLNAIKKVRKKITATTKTEAKPLTEAELYLRGIEKLNREAKANQKGLVNFESYFTNRVTAFLGRLPLIMFQKALQDLNIGLLEEEIKYFLHVKTLA